MKKIKFLFVAVLVICFSCQKEKDSTDNLTVGNLSISPSKPVGGESVTINYLGNDSLTEGIYYYLVKNRAFPLDVNFSAEKKATISIPDSAQAIAFQLKKGETYDNNNEQGYLIPLSDASGAYIPGSKSSLAYFSLTTGKRQGIDKNADSLLLDIKNDINKHPKLKDDWYFTYLTMNNRINKSLDEGTAMDYANSLTSKANVPEEDYNKAITIYKMLNQKDVADSLNKVAVTKYPNGKIMKNKYVSKFFQEQNPDKKMQLFKDNEQYFNKQFKDYALSSFARTHAKNKDYDAFFECTDSISDKNLLASTYNNLAWGLVKKDEDLKVAEKISKKSLDLIESLQNKPDSKPDYLSENQFQKSLKSNYLMYADTYAWILFKNGNTKDAIKYQAKVAEKIDVGNLDKENVFARYIEFLLADKQYKKAQTKAEAYIKNGAANATMYPHLKEVYKEIKGSTDGYETYLADLKTIGDNIVLSKTKKKMLNEPAPDFKLKNLDGNYIALNDLKGKVVVLDFWATWCGPCKASFPGMQKAVNKYKNNPNVEFLFIDSRERGSKEEIFKNVTDFINKNNYTFNVLFDTKKEENSNEYDIISKYKVGGIPTKIIIGNDGNIKFRSVGFSGSAEGLVKELDDMIKLAQS